MDCSPAGLSVHGIFHARILEWVAISFSRDLPDPGIEPESPALQVDSLPLNHLGIPAMYYLSLSFDILILGILNVVFNLLWTFMEAKFLKRKKKLQKNSSLLSYIHMCVCVCVCVCVYEYPNQCMNIRIYTCIGTHNS